MGEEAEPAVEIRWKKKEVSLLKRVKAHLFSRRRKNELDEDLAFGTFAGMRTFSRQRHHPSSVYSGGTYCLPKDVFNEDPTSFCMVSSEPQIPSRFPTSEPEAQDRHWAREHDLYSVAHRPNWTLLPFKCVPRHRWELEGAQTDTRQATNRSDDEYTRRGEQSTGEYRRYIAPDIASNYDHEPLPSFGDERFAVRTWNAPPLVPPRIRLKEPVPPNARETGRESGADGEGELSAVYYSGWSDDEEDCAVTTDDEVQHPHTSLVDSRYPQRNQAMPFDGLQGRRSNDQSSLW